MANANEGALATGTVTVVDEDAKVLAKGTVPVVYEDEEALYQWPQKNWVLDDQY